MISIGVNIAHHSVMQKGVFLSQSVNVGALTRIQERCFLGFGTIIRGGAIIGRNSLIGAGTVVINDVDKNSVMI